MHMVYLQIMVFIINLKEYLRFVTETIVFLKNFHLNKKKFFLKTVTSLISSVLADQRAKTPAYGANSPLYFENRPVAVKTGTTNDYRDVWVIGYTPSIVIGMWGGNNDNTPIRQERQLGLVLAPIWRKAMATALATSSS